MIEKGLPNIYELVEKLSEFKNRCKTFDPISLQLVKLINIHYTLIFDIEKAVNQHEYTGYANELTEILCKLYTNVQIIILIIENITHRNIQVHNVQDKDTLWKIAKRYNSNINEISELNNIRSIFLLEEHRIILIPIV